MINLISKLIIPFLLVFVLIYGNKKCDVYNTFIEGSKESYKMIVNLFPTLLAMILGINLLLESNILDILANFISKIVPVYQEVIPIALLRPISGSSSLALLNNIYLTKVIIGSTETTFYVISLYFSIIGIKKIRYALKVSLIADLISFIISIIVVKILFG